ncbi:MAG: hypothetical protein WAT71_07920 [Ignavibacteria bacterium]
MKKNNLRNFAILFLLFIIQVNLNANDKTSQKQENTGDHHNVNKNKIELYDLVQEFLPNEDQTDDLTGWEKLDDIKSVHWGDKYYNDYNGSYTQKGNTVVTINGKSFKNAGGRNNINEWVINIEGKDKGWSNFSILFVYNFSTNFEYEEYYYYQIQNLFPGKSFESQLLYNENEWMYIYELKFPDKKKCWLKIWTRGNKIPEFMLDFYLNENDVNSSQY